MAKKIVNCRPVALPPETIKKEGRNLERELS